MSDVPVLLALAAGVVAAVNPCGFAVLPAYLSLLVVADEPLPAVADEPLRPGADQPLVALADKQPPRTAAIGRALALTGAMTTGFVAVFGAFGLVLAPVAGLVQSRLPWFTIGFGFLLAVLGGWLVAGQQLPALPWKAARAPRLTRSLPSMALFGVAYALASMSCTIGPFLAIVGSSMRAGSAAEGAGLFLAYAGGMGLVVGTMAMGVALARASLVRRLRAAAAGLSRAGGALLVVTGGYVAYYGRYELRVTSGRGGGDAVIRAATSMQQRLAGALDHGAAIVLVAALFAVLLAAGMLRRRALARAEPRTAPARRT
jgi:cytochrome c-type biogenesis protein